MIKKQEEKLVVETTAAATAAEAEEAAVLTAFRPWEKVLSIPESRDGDSGRGSAEPKKAFLAQ